MSTAARKELAAIIAKCFRIHPNGVAYIEHTEAADAIIAAGYHKPRTITTVEERDALAEGSVVAGDWATHQLILGTWVTFGSPTTSQPELPATVLWEPEA